MTDKRCDLALPLCLSTRMKPHQRVMRIVSSRLSIKSEWPSIHRVILVVWTINKMRKITAQNVYTTVNNYINNRTAYVLLHRIRASHINTPLFSPPKLTFILSAWDILLSLLNLKGKKDYIIHWNTQRQLYTLKLHFATIWAFFVMEVIHITPCILTGLDVWETGSLVCALNVRVLSLTTKKKKKTISFSCKLHYKLQYDLRISD